MLHFPFSRIKACGISGRRDGVSTYLHSTTLGFEQYLVLTLGTEDHQWSPNLRRGGRCGAVARRKGVCGHHRVYSKGLTRIRYMWEIHIHSDYKTPKRHLRKSGMERHYKKEVIESALEIDRHPKFEVRRNCVRLSWPSRVFAGGNALIMSTRQNCCHRDRCSREYAPMKKRGLV